MHTVVPTKDVEGHRKRWLCAALEPRRWEKSATRTHVIDLYMFYKEQNLIALLSSW